MNARSPKPRPRGYWTKTRCAEEAAKHATIKDFREAAVGAYIAALENGWLKEITAHMPQPVRWSRETAGALALGFTTRQEFRRAHRGAYDWVVRQKLDGELFAHMPIPRNKTAAGTKYPNGYWTRTRCRDAAAECETLAEFYTEHAPAYQAAWVSGWLPDIQKENGWSGNFRKSCRILEKQ